MNKQSIFSDRHGKPSMMRVITIAGLVFAMVLTAYSVITNTVSENFAVILTWIMTAYGGKGLQSFPENMNRSEDK